MVYKNVKKLAEDNNMTIRQVELKAKLGNGTIARWKKSTPSVITLKKVADVFGVTIEGLLKDEKVEV